ncbi:MAG TPA: RHS repeat-associated core domain-containing protein [Puia sp.]|nr:RHS repeat-associated core domain-containing protein [Puia sp.]
MQRNLRNRVSYTSITNSSSNPANYDQASLYSYDIEGNADTVLQDYGSSAPVITHNMMNLHGHRWKKFVYKYDLISGKVNQVRFQPGLSDGWIHNYVYDAENRLIKVQTSPDSVLWQTDAQYQYYKHGPLARMLLGDQQVQGIDYAYTLQGWLKGVNSNAVDSLRDMGGDAFIGGVNQNTGKDIFGFSLNYFTGDYASINTGVAPFPGYSAYLPSGAYKPLYNGNISSMAVTLNPLAAVATGGRTLFYNYTYDQLNRYTGMDVLNNFNKSGNSWSAIAAIVQYKERVTYDANGNILKFLRNGNSAGAALVMDSLGYQYYAGTNRLQRIRDSVSSTRYGTYDDLDDQPANNYVYDSVGNLIKDSAESIKNIKWSVYGKPLEITRTSTSDNALIKILYYYDAQGNRIGKVQTFSSTGNRAFTWYSRDAQGNIISMYSGTGPSDTSLIVNAARWMTYGSSRVGVFNNITTMSTGPTSLASVHEFTGNRGLRYYELDNHLGSELAAVTDKKIAVPSVANSALVGYYNADVASAQEYYPFGYRMPNRFISTTSYWFGFNGKEKDNEVKGEWNQYDYEMRIYDPRIGRFLSKDPLSVKYPWYTPYQYAGNKPIQFTDYNGLEENSTSTYVKPPTTMFFIQDIYTVDLEKAKVALSGHSSFGDPKGLKATTNVIKVGNSSFALPQGVTPQQALATLYDRFGDVRTGTISDPYTNDYDEIARSTLFPYSPHEQRGIKEEKIKEVFDDATSKFLFALAPLQGIYENNQLSVPKRFGGNVGPGSLIIEEGGAFSASEIRAAKYLQSLENDVVLRKPIGARSGGETSDLLVNGKLSYDVYTPNTKSLNRLVSAIAKKNSQATGVVIDLNNTTLKISNDQKANILKRVQNAGGTNIRDIIIIKRN